MIKTASNDDEIERCFPVMAQLRPHLLAQEFTARIRQQMTASYQLIYLEADGSIAAVAGYRIKETLFLGRHLYVDDLVTDAARRSQGLGAQLFSWLVEFARREGCTHLELDSGVQRLEAHRFYLREGMAIRSHHFSLPIE